MRALMAEAAADIPYKLIAFLEMHLYKKRMSRALANDCKSEMKKKGENKVPPIRELTKAFNMERRR
jgi:hypothetical protein